MTVVLSTLTLAQVTDLYNLISEKPVKKFENKVKAVARLEALLLATDNEVFEVDGEYDVRPLAQASVITFTDLEYGMMDVIAHAEHNQTNGATPTQKSDVHTWLWADEFGKALGISAQAAGGVLSSLEQKGALWMDVSGKKEDHAVGFEQAGFDAWKLEHEAGRVYTAPKKVAKATRVKGGKRGPAPEFKDDQVIDVLVANPKKNGSAARVRFDLYKNGMTVGQFLAAGGTRADLAWDSQRSFISIGKAH
jgi:hypothetical protein